MTSLQSDRAWTGGDPISKLLVDLAADRRPSLPSSPNPSLLELAQRHGLVGVMASQSMAALVKAIQARNQIRQSVMTRHLGNILELLDRAGIRTAVVKGPDIASRYANPDQRGFGDLDLLVEEAALDRAVEAIGDYEAVVSIPSKRPKADKRDIYLRDPSGVRFNIDLHWDLYSYTQLRGAALGAVAEAWSHADHVPDSPLGPRWLVPGSALVCFLTAHAILDHRFRLILFRDLLELARHSIPEDLVEFAARWGLRSTSYVPLWVAREALGAPIPSAVLDELRPPSAPIRFLERALPRVDMVRFDGHRAHPVNLAGVLLHDRRSDRIALTIRAPVAFPGWLRRIADEEAVDQPRILIVASTDRRRGAEVFTERLRSGLIERGWLAEAVSLTSSGIDPRADLETLTGLSPDQTRRLEPSIVAALRRKIRSFGPDVVIANGGATLRYGVIATLGIGAALVYVAIGEPEYWLRSARARLVNRWLLRRVDRILAVSRRTREQLVGIEPGLERRIEVVPTGVPTELFSIPRRGHDGPLRVLMVGSLSPEKDPLAAVEAVAMSDRAVLRLVGDGPLMAEVSAAVERHRVGDRVELVGSVGDVSPHLEWADVLVLTSQTEGLPGAILEAGAAGVPTVAFDVGGVGDAVVHGETGLLIPHGDVSGLAGALVKLETDRDLVAALGEAARRRTRESFELGRVLDRYHAVLSEVLRR